MTYVINVHKTNSGLGFIREDVGGGGRTTYDEDIITRPGEIPRGLPVDQSPDANLKPMNPLVRGRISEATARILIPVNPIIRQPIVDESKIFPVQPSRLKMDFIQRPTKVDYVKVGGKVVPIRNQEPRIDTEAVTVKQYYNETGRKAIQPTRAGAPQDDSGGGKTTLLIGAAMLAFDVWKLRSSLFGS